MPNPSDTVLHCYALTHTSTHIWLCIVRRFYHRPEGEATKKKCVTKKNSQSGDQDDTEKSAYSFMIYLPLFGDYKKIIIVSLLRNYIFLENTSSSLFFW